MLNPLSKIIAFALALYAAGACADISGLADFRGLFLLDQANTAFSATGVTFSDSLSTERLTAYGKYRSTTANAKWGSGWLLKLRHHSEEIGGGISGRFRYLDLGSEFSSLASIREYATWHTSDSLLFAYGSMALADLQLLQFHWDDRGIYNNEMVPQIEGQWKTEIFIKTLGLGSKYKNHELGIYASFINTDPPDFREEHYSLRDSTEASILRGSYRYTGNASSFLLRYLYLGLEGRLTGRRTDEENVKRFAYIPFEVNLHLGNLLFNGTRGHDDFSVGAAFVHLELNVPAEDRRFYESLSLNRVLDASVLQVLSFSVYNVNYRIWGNVKGTALMLNGDYWWNNRLNNVTLSPGIAVNGFLVWASSDIMRKTEKGNVFGNSRKTMNMYHEFFVAGALPTFSLKVESKKLLAQVSVSQAIPISWNKRKTEELVSTYYGNTPGPGSATAPGNSGNSGSSSSHKGDSDDKKNYVKNLSRDIDSFRYHPFRDGFMLHTQVGVTF